jgi:hypothetical protein
MFWTTERLVNEAVLIYILSARVERAIRALMRQFTEETLATKISRAKLAAFASGGIVQMQAMTAAIGTNGTEAIVPKRSTSRR